MVDLKKALKITAIGFVTAGFIAGIAGTIVYHNKYTQTDKQLQNTALLLNEKVAELNNLTATLNEVEQEIATLQQLNEQKTSLINETLTKLSDLQTQKNELTIKISQLQDELEQYKLELDERDTATLSVLWDDDDYKFGDFIDTTILKHHDTKFLRDASFEYDGEDYDFHEEIILGDKIGVQTANYDLDFETTPYLVLDGTNQISYKVVFDDEVEISDDEILEVPFMDKTLEISKIGNDEITIINGKDLVINDGEEKTVTIDGETYTISVLGGNSDKETAIIKVNDEIKTVSKNTLKTISGLDVKVNDVFINNINDANIIVDITVGEDVETTIEDGDDYFDNESYQWIVKTSNDKLQELGVTFVDKVNDLDDGVVTEGETFNFADYFGIQFNNIENLDNYVTLSFSVDDEKVTIKSDEDETLLVNNEEIDNDKIEFDGNLVYYKIDGDKYNTTLDNVKLDFEDTTATFTFNNNKLKIPEFKFVAGIDFQNNNVTFIKENGIDLTEKDENYLFNNGLVIKDPESGVDNNDFEISLPEGKPQYTFEVVRV